MLTTKRHIPGYWRSFALGIFVSPDGFESLLIVVLSEADDPWGLESKGRGTHYEVDSKVRELWWVSWSFCSRPRLEEYEYRRQAHGVGVKALYDDAKGPR